MTLTSHVLLLGWVAQLCSGIGAQSPANVAVGPPKLLIVYWTHTGYTHQLAEAIAGGAQTVLPGANVRVQPTNSTTIDDILNWADGILLGSPTYFGNPAGQFKSWIDTEWEPFWTDPRFSTKFGAAFATGGGMAQGVEHTNSCIQRILASFRVKLLQPDPTRSGYASYGPVAVTGTYPFNTSALGQPWVDSAATFGVKFATILSSEVQNLRILQAYHAEIAE